MWVLVDSLYVDRMVQREATAEDTVLTPTMQAATDDLRQRDALPPAVAKVFSEDRKRLAAAGVPMAAVSIGERVDDFTLPDALGRRVSLRSLVMTGPTVLVFYRGAWCPYCNVALARYQAELLPELAAYEATMAAISPERPDAALSLAERHALAFPLLTDTGAYVAKGLGIATRSNQRVLNAQKELGLDVIRWNDAGTADLPMPAVVVIDRDLTARFVDVRPDYSSRTEVADIVGALGRIA